MSETLHQFGRVLFDELEQVAVRRGGFPSLHWVKENLKTAQRSVKTLREEAANSTADLSSLRKRADECARRARDALVLADRTAEAVGQLA